MKVLMIGRLEHGEKNDVSLLATSINSQKLKYLSVRSIFFEDILISVSEKTVDVSFGNSTIDEFDLVVMIGWSHKKIYSDIAHSIAWICEQRGIKVWNSELVATRSMTKISQLVRLSGQKIPMPETWFAFSKDVLLKKLQILQYPIILKDPEASRGRDNFLVKSFLEAKKIIQQYDGYLLAQSYIANDGSDFRILIANGEPVLVIKRIATESSHLTNISAGGKAVIVDNLVEHKDMLNKAIIIAYLFKRELCGIDFMRSTIDGRYYFLEVNLTPQIVNGAFVEYKIKGIASAMSKM